jgi:hypothetical protein
VKWEEFGASKRKRKMSRGVWWGNLYKKKPVERSGHRWCIILIWILNK